MVEGSALAVFRVSLHVCVCVLGPCTRGSAETGSGKGRQDGREGGREGGRQSMMDGSTTTVGTCPPSHPQATSHECKEPTVVQHKDAD